MTNTLPLALLILVAALLYSSVGHAGASGYLAAMALFNLALTNLSKYPEEVVRKQLATSYAWHDYAHSRGKIASDLASAEERVALPPQCWRLAWKNPVNGRNALYIASHAYAIEGMEQAAAQKVLGELMDAATAPGLSYVHSWRKGDVVMWDNRATMHRGRPWPAHEARLMVRTTISATEADGLASVRPPSRQAAE